MEELPHHDGDALPGNVAHFGYCDGFSQPTIDEGPLTRFADHLPVTPPARSLSAIRGSAQASPVRSLLLTPWAGVSWRCTCSNETSPGHDPRGGRASLAVEVFAGFVLTLGTAYCFPEPHLPFASSPQGCDRKRVSRPDARSRIAGSPPPAVPLCWKG